MLIICTDSSLQLYTPLLSNCKISIIPNEVPLSGTEWYTITTVEVKAKIGYDYRMKSVKNRDIPNVSFIIPTLNAAWILPKCLNAIRAQNYPQKKVEIVIADGGSTDKTISIAKKYKAKVISNPEVLHEPGKARASEVATGKILFFTDSDNILSHKNWLQDMVVPHREYSGVVGFLSQTEPPPDSGSLNRYLGYLFTDPFTWFVYGNAANPKDYDRVYTPIKKTDGYKIYKFSAKNHPLFGLSQGVGTLASFKREKLGWSDDILSGIKIIKEGGLVAYVPSAGVYHYHVKGYNDFLKKYRWRIKNNLIQQVKGMGYKNRRKYMNRQRRQKQALFIPYSLSIVFPLLDSVRLAIKYRDPVMLWHLPACLGLTKEIMVEYTLYYLGFSKKITSAYGR